MRGYRPMWTWLNFLLAPYVIDLAIALAVKYLESYKQAIAVAPMELAKRLFTMALL